MDLQNTLWALSAGSQLIVLLTLLRRRLVQRYVWFFVYLATAIIKSLVLKIWGGRPGTTTYAILWMIGEVVLMVTLVVTVRELVERLPIRYYKFGSFGRAKLRQLFEGAILIALVSAVFEAGGRHWTYSIGTWLPLVFTLKRVIMSVLACYLVLVRLFVLRYPPLLERNFNVHLNLLMTYSAFASFIMLWQNTTEKPHVTAVRSIVLLAGSSALFVCWALFLTREGEVVPPAQEWSDEQIAQSEAREEELLKIAKRAFIDGSPR